MASRKSIFRVGMAHKPTTEQRSSSEAGAETALIGGIPQETIAQAIAAMSPASLVSFLDCVKQDMASAEEEESQKKPDHFANLVAICARDTDHGRAAIANLLPHFGDFSHPEFACFAITSNDDNDKDNDDEKKESGSSQAVVDGNEVASFMLGKDISIEGSGWNVACALDASGSMDAVADLIQDLVSGMAFVPIWSTFGSKHVDVEKSPKIAQVMGIRTGTKSCTRHKITARPGTLQAKGQRFSALHGVSHKHMLDMVSYRERDQYGCVSSLYFYQTYVANLFNLAWAMHHRAKPFALVIIGDGEFDDMDTLPAQLELHKEAFGQCRKLIFVAAPHISQRTIHELADMFSSFVGTTEGCVFSMLQPRSRDADAMKDLAQDVFEATKAASNMQHIPGYQVLVSDEGPIYIPWVDRRGLIRVMEYQPDMAWRLARLIITVVSERSTASRVLEDPLFSKVYGALIALRYNDSDTLRQACEWVKTELSAVKITVLEKIKNTPHDDETMVFHVIHRDLVDKLIDDSKKDPEAATKTLAELEEIVADAHANEQQVHYLCAIRQMSIETVKSAIRQMGDESRVDEDLMVVLKNFFTSDSATAGQQDTVAVPFVVDRPRSVVLALSLMFRVYGFDDIVVKGRPLLLICLRYCYDFVPASVENRDGVDPTMVLLSREFLRHFTNYFVLGLAKEAETGEWVIKEFFDYMMNPLLMRLLLRAHNDFGIIPCQDLVDILRNFYRARALLLLLNSKQFRRAITLSTTVSVHPPGADGFTFRIEEYLPTDPSDERVQKRMPTLVPNPKRKKWRATMTYDQYMDSIGVPKEERKALRSFHPEEHCAAPHHRPAIENVKARKTVGGINAMLDTLLGVCLLFHDDGSIECTSCAWTAREFQRIQLDDGSFETWKDYWGRNQGTLIRTLKLQHKAVLSKMRVEDVRREWQQRGWVAVELDGFPMEAKVAYPVHKNGKRVEVPDAEMGLLPGSLVMERGEFVPMFASSTSGETKAVPDHYDLPIEWKTLFSTEGIPEALGLNPHVVRLLMDKNRISGTRLKFELAPELMECYDTPFDVPPDGQFWDISFKENYFTDRYNVRVKGHCHLALDSNTFGKIRRELWERLEKFMRVKLSLRDVDDEDAVATCWICAEEQRVGAKDFWLDLKGCCGQALCVSCFERSTRVDALPLRLFPKCPFCSSPIDLGLLEQFPDEVHGSRGQRLAWMQTHVRRPNPVDGCYTVAGARTVGKTNNFSLCHQCNHVIATPRNCAARVDDLPSICSACVSAVPDDVKTCPSCSAKIQRIDGCDNVRCICGQNICWVCGEGVEDHDPNHFIDGYFSGTCIRTQGPGRGRGRRRRQARWGL